jgi:type 2A phosphatase activator TIP41
MEQGERKFEHKGWEFSCRTSHILPSNDIETWEKELDVPKIPGMVFGNNYLTLKHPESNLMITFNAYEAVKSWREAPWYGTALTVAYASEWSQMREHPEDLAESKPYDWTFTPDYMGTISNSSNANLEKGLEMTYAKIDVNELKKPDPILFFDEITLFDDELDDNGLARLNIKVRVMPTCMFVLMRFWLRVDGVLFRIKDTRVFHKFGSDQVLVEVTTREETFPELKKRNALPPPMNQNDQNLIAQLILVKQSQTFKIDL